MKGRIMQANLTEGNSKESMEVFLYKASNTEEPYAGKPHAGICEGGGQVTGRPTSINYK